MRGRGRGRGKYLRKSPSHRTSDEPLRDGELLGGRAISDDLFHVFVHEELGGGLGEDLDTVQAVPLEEATHSSIGPEVAESTQHAGVLQVAPNFCLKLHNCFQPINNELL